MMHRINSIYVLRSHFPFVSSSKTQEVSHYPYAPFPKKYAIGSVFHRNIKIVLRKYFPTCSVYNFHVKQKMLCTFECMPQSLSKKGILSRQLRRFINISMAQKLPYLWRQMRNIRKRIRHLRQLPRLWLWRQASRL